jgi:sugar-specific transcriptional regulator TrmB
MPGNRRVGRPGDLSGIDPEIARGLDFLGLTAYEIRVYDAILRHPFSRVPEISRISRVPQPKVYSTLKRLIERGLCENHLGPINQYTVREPEQGFTQLVKETMARHEQAQRAVSKLQTQHEKAGEGMSRREGRVKLFQGKMAAARDFNELMSAVERDVAIVARFPLMVADYLDHVARLVGTGGQARILCETSGNEGEEGREFCRRARTAGARIRKLAHVPMRMGVFDARILVLPMNDPVAEQGDGFMMLEVRNPDLCASFLEIFDMLWATGKRMS